MMQPRLVFSDLSGRVYVVTRYSSKPGRDGREIIVASKKYDVTEDFHAVVHASGLYKRRVMRRKKESR